MADKPQPLCIMRMRSPTHTCLTVQYRQLDKGGWRIYICVSQIREGDSKSESDHGNDNVNDSDRVTTAMTMAVTMTVTMPMTMRGDLGQVQVKISLGLE